MSPDGFQMISSRGTVPGTAGTLSLLAVSARAEAVHEKTARPHVTNARNDTRLSVEFSRSDHLYFIFFVLVIKFIGAMM
jgi:hypothetical protein